MQLFIRVPQTTNNTLLIDYGPTDTIYDIKCKLFNITHIPVVKLNIFYVIKKLEDDKCFDDYDILNNSTLDVFIS